VLLFAGPLRHPLIGLAGLGDFVECCSSGLLRMT
jgi:hypothetical protein